MFSYKQKFIKINKSLWSKIPIKKDVVLVEGRPYINQIIASSLAAKAIQEVKKTPSVVWLSSNQDKDVYQSFSIEKILYKKKYILRYFYYIFPRAIYEMCKLFVQMSRRTNKIDYFIDFYKIDGIRLGDLIYDAYIRNNFSFLNPNIYSVKFVSIFIPTIIEFFAIKCFFKVNNVKYVVVSKWQYNNSGALIARYALFNKVKAVNISFDKARIIDNYNHLFHDSFKIFKLDTFDFNEDVANKEIDKRFLGVGVGFDLKNISSGKVWSVEDLSTYFGCKYDKSKKNVFIMLHAFSDANHLSGKLIYRDYYKWFKETIKIINSLPNVNWIVKEHPSSKEYYEEELVSNFFDCNITSENVFLLPNSFNTKSVINIADAVITARGTIALEASVFGIPSILSGESNFSHLGFTHDSENVTQYENFLKNIESMPRLNKKQILLAKKAFVNYSLVSDLKLSEMNYSWVFPINLYPLQTPLEKLNVEESYFKRLYNVINATSANKRDSYYGSIYKALTLLK